VQTRRLNKYKPYHSANLTRAFIILKKRALRGIFMTVILIDELEYRINQMRKTLILIAVETGLDSDDTLCYSQKLDKLIARYQKLKMNNTREKDDKSCMITL